jgi:protein-L-isoaspartate(D-aspartate) O-methyltransferase
MEMLRSQNVSRSRGRLFSIFSFPISALLCVYLFSFATALLSCSAQQTTDDQYRALREAMVRDQIATQRYSGAPPVRDARVLDVMRRTPRHLFVPPAQARYAYEDRPLPIGRGQTISQPYMVAIMTELLDTKKEQRVLEIGTGSGYQAAVLSPLVAEVYTIEIVEPLGREAGERLRSLGYKNIEVRIGDGYLGWPEKSPFDRIIVTAGAEHIPIPLVEQLVPGGRMVIPVGPSGQMQILKLVIKGKRGPRDFRTEDVMPVAFVPLVREKKPR